MSENNSQQLFNNNNNNNKNNTSNLTEKRREGKKKNQKKKPIPWMGVATRTNKTRLFCSSCGWCHTICVRIPRAACAPKLMQERRVVTFELWWLDKLDEKIKSSGCRESGNRVRNERSLALLALTNIQGPVEKHRPCPDSAWATIWHTWGWTATGPEFHLGTSPSSYANESVMLIRPSKIAFLLSFPASCFYLVVLTEQVLQY